MFSDLLSRAERTAIDFEENRERRSEAEKLHLAGARPRDDKVAGKHKEAV